MNIAIISSAHPELPNFLGPTLDVLIAQLKTIPNIKILTGGSLGIPGEIVKKANKAGIHTVAYSPDEDKEKHHKRHDNLRLHHFNEVKHFPGFTMRSLEMIKDADCVIALMGAWALSLKSPSRLKKGREWALSQEQEVSLIILKISAYSLKKIFRRTYSFLMIQKKWSSGLPVNNVRFY